jgi:hypothetical protein
MHVMMNRLYVVSSIHPHANQQSGRTQGAVCAAATHQPSPGHLAGQRLSLHARLIAAGGDVVRAAAGTAAISTCSLHISSVCITADADLIHLLRLLLLLVVTVLPLRQATVLHLLPAAWFELAAEHLAREHVA